MSNLRKITLVAGLVAAMATFAGSAHAHDILQKKDPLQLFLEDWFPFWFEEPDTGPKPEDTGQAPFIEKGTVDTKESKQLGVDYKPFTALESGASIDQPHRQPAQITEWTTKAISDSLDFDPMRYDAHLESLTATLTPFATESFKTFMAKDSLLEALKTNDLVIRAFVTEPSRLLNQGTVQGRYRWLVETPLTISFLPRGTQDYTGIQPKSQRINVRTQIGRVAEGGVDGMVVETLDFVPVAVPK